MNHMSVEVDEVEPPVRAADVCEFCRHGWHGLECRNVMGPPINAELPMWPSIRGRRCECPSAFVEPPC